MFIVEQSTITLYFNKKERTLKLLTFVPCYRKIFKLRKTQ